MLWNVLILEVALWSHLCSVVLPLWPCPTNLQYLWHRLRPPYGLSQEFETSDSAREGHWNRAVLGAIFLISHYGGLGSWFSLFPRLEFPVLGFHELHQCSFQTSFLCISLLEKVLVETKKIYWIQIIMHRAAWLNKIIYVRALHKPKFILHTWLLGVSLLLNDLGFAGIRAPILTRLLDLGSDLCSYDLGPVLVPPSAKWGSKPELIELPWE